MVSDTFSDRIHKLSGAAIFLTLWTMAGVSKADFITYQNTSPTTLGTPEWFGDLTFQQFDPSLGVLTSVYLELYSGLTVTGTFDGAAPNSRVTINALEIFTVLDPTDTFILGAAYPAGTTGTAITASSDASGSGAFTIIASGDVLFGYNTAYLMNGFTGTNTVSLPFTAGPISITATGPGDPTAIGTGQSSLDASVTYDYTPFAAPAPGGFTLAFVATVVFVCARLTRRRLHSARSNTRATRTRFQ